MAEYSLPDLPYDYGALEPHISGKIMELHHDKHHNTYVTGANSAVDALAEAREQDTIGTTVNLWEKNLAFNLAGHVNHTAFWPNMSPDGGDKPDGELAAAIDDASPSGFPRRRTHGRQHHAQLPTEGVPGQRQAGLRQGLVEHCQLGPTPQRFEAARGLTLVSRSSPTASVGPCARSPRRRALPGPTLTRIVDRMVATDLVDRRADTDDRRRVLVSLTSRGRTLHRRLGRLVEAEYAVIEERVGVTEMAQLTRLLDRLLAHVDP